MIHGKKTMVTTSISWDVLLKKHSFDWKWSELGGLIHQFQRIPAISQCSNIFCYILINSSLFQYCWLYTIYMYNTIYPLNLFASHMFRQHQVQFSLDLPHSLDSWHILAHLGTSWPQNKTLICSWTNGFVWYGTNVAGMRNLMFNQWTWLFVRYFSDKPAQTTLSNLWNNTLQLHFFSDLATKHSQWGRQRLVDSHPRNSWNRCFFILPYFEA